MPQSITRILISNRPVHAHAQGWFQIIHTVSVTVLYCGSARHWYTHGHLVQHPPLVPVYAGVRAQTTV